MGKKERPKDTKAHTIYLPLDVHNKVQAMTPYGSWEAALAKRGKCKSRQEDVETRACCINLRQAEEAANLGNDEFILPKWHWRISAMLAKIVAALVGSCNIPL
jgi:hypothetical protein